MIMKCRCSDEHNRTLVVTDLPPYIGGSHFPELADGMEITINYVTPKSGVCWTTSRAIMLDNVIIPAIVKALNKRNR